MEQVSDKKARLFHGRGGAWGFSSVRRTAGRCAVMGILAGGIFVLAGGMAGCTRKTVREGAVQASETGTKTVADAVGRQVTMPSPVRSIVCVNVGTLRFTAYMRALDLVIGVEKNELQPNIEKLFNYMNTGLISKLPVTGDNGTVYVEEIVRLSPDIIMASVDRETADALQSKTGIPVFVIPLIDNMFDSASYDTFRLMGDVYDRQERADELITYIKGLEQDLTDRTKNIKDEDKPTVYAGGISFKGAHGFEGTEAGYSPFYAIGAKNIADGTGQRGAFNIDLEQVLRRNPDIIFLDFNGLGLINEDYAKRPGFYQAFGAIRDGRVYSQISFRFNAVNAEIALADAYYAGKVIFPRQFEDVDPIQKADEIFDMMLGVKCYALLKAAGYEFKPLKIGE
ncbi:MAG: iron ABC transporter substrate-binding protein [Spirochaetaceae bacterium]|jgi:iron complex transport system substrate-binding protein|nr:iron ABC transporter substrate-binding protein [Spirochaetaceae bacterium]